MKNTSSKIKRGAAALGLGIGLAFGFDASAVEPVAPTIGWFTNGAVPYPITLTNGQTVTLNSTNVVKLYRDRGMGFNFLAAGTNTTSTDPLTFYYDLATDDSTNFTTTTPLIWGQAMNGNTWVRGGTNACRDKLDNYRKVRLTKIVNGNTNTIVLTNAGWSVIP